MITLITANPGTGKTLFALADTIERAEKENRPVCVCNFQRFSEAHLFNPDHPLYEKVKDWIELDYDDLTTHLWDLYDDKHPKIPQGAIVLVDECQDLYPTRHKGDVPHHLKFFEKHRHTGSDFVLITQKLRQVDIHLRSLVGEHLDLKRPFGMQKIVVKRLDRIQEGKDETSPEIVTSRRSYPKKIYGLYKSAVQHTHKRKIPAIAYAIPLLIAMIAGLIWYVFTILDYGHTEKSAQEKPALQNTVSPVPVSQPQNLDEIINGFTPSQVSDRYRIAFFDDGPTVLIADDSAVYPLSKKDHCRYHSVYRFICFFEKKFIIMKGSQNAESTSSSGIPL